MILNCLFTYNIVFNISLSVSLHVTWIVKWIVNLRSYVICSQNKYNMPEHYEITTRCYETFMSISWYTAPPNGDIVFNVIHFFFGGGI